MLLEHVTNACWEHLAVPDVMESHTVQSQLLAHFVTYSLEILATLGTTQAPST